MGMVSNHTDVRIDGRAIFLHRSGATQTVNAATRHKFIWGWLRLFLGFVQMSLAAASVGALFAVGVRPVTLVFVICATATALNSRLLYHGRRDPKPGSRKSDNQNKGQARTHH